MNEENPSKGATLFMGALVGAAGMFSLFVYAIPSFEYFSNPDVPVRNLIIGELLTLGAFYVAFRFVRESVAHRKKREMRWVFPPAPNLIQARGYACLERTARSG